MALHVFTQEEFDAIPREEYGWKYCPTGDYTQIKNFPKQCVFGPCSVFGNSSVFGEWATFGSDSVLGSLCQLGNWSQLGDNCRLGNNCRLGKDCQLGNHCQLGNGCLVGDDCDLGDDCRLGNWCQVGGNCRLGYHCRLGDRFQFGANVVFENGLVRGNVSILKVAYIGSRKDSTYFWKHDGGIFVRCGCFAGDIAEIKQCVEETHKNNPQHLKEYRGAIQYAKTVFGVEETS